jgi:hypothetical protein
VEVTLRPLFRPLGFVALSAGVATSPQQLHTGVAPQYELGFELSKRFSLALGYVAPLTGMATARLLFVHELFEFGMLARLALLEPGPAFSHVRGPVLGGGLTLGKAFETPVGALGLRAEAMIGRNFDEKVSEPVVPLSLAAYWRL